MIRIYFHAICIEQDQESSKIKSRTENSEGLRALQASQNKTL